MPGGSPTLEGGLAQEQLAWGRLSSLPKLAGSSQVHRHSLSHAKCSLLFPRDISKHP